MKLIATIVAIATASTAISYDTKVGACSCCRKGSITCCALCIWPDTKVQSLTTIQVIGLNLRRHRVKLK